MQLHPNALNEQTNYWLCSESTTTYIIHRYAFYALQLIPYDETAKQTCYVSLHFERNFKYLLAHLSPEGDFQSF